MKHSDLKRIGIWALFGLFAISLWHQWRCLHQSLTSRNQETEGSFNLLHNTFATRKGNETIYPIESSTATTTKGSVEQGKGMKRRSHDMDELVNKESINSQVSSKFKLLYIDPLETDLFNRFDILVKTVYAISFFNEKTVPLNVKKIYKRHLQVWNEFKEPCTFTGDVDWYDAKTPCVKKSSAQDFISSFEKTMKSIQRSGFDNSKSLVPVSKKLFPLNGAHRIAAAIALSLHSMPVQVTKSTALYKWDEKFFLQKGFEKGYAEYVKIKFLQHTQKKDPFLLKYMNKLLVSTNLHAIILFPSTKNQYLDEVKAIINKNVHIIAERQVVLCPTGADMFVQQLYPDESWAQNGAWGKTKLCYPIGTEKYPTRIIFVSTKKTMAEILKMKKTVRKLYGIGKHSIHISDTFKQAMQVAQIVLNYNSLKFINSSKWSSISQRKNSVCIKPTDTDETHRYYIDSRPCKLQEIPANKKGIYTACSGIHPIVERSKKQWVNLEQMWEALDAAHVKYAILRNFETGLLKLNDMHPDVDILLESLEPACCIMTVYGGPESHCKRNVQNQGQHITIGKIKIKLDIRILGDHYYDDKWVHGMLNRRVKGKVPNSIAWSVSQEDLLFSLIYHVLVHKNKISPDYPSKICSKAKKLGYSLKTCSDRGILFKFLIEKWMVPKGYRFVRPRDLNVPYNAPKKKNKHNLLNSPKSLESHPNTLKQRLGFFKTEGAKLRLVGGYLCDGALTNAKRDLRVLNKMLDKQETIKNKFLVYKTQTGRIGGLGSRLFGIANVFLWAVLSNRKFVIEHDHPRGISEIFAPNIARWDVTAPNNKRFRERLIDRTLNKTLLLYGDLESRWGKYNVVEVSGANMPSEPFLRKNPRYNLAASGFPSLCENEFVARYKENRRRLNKQMHMWKAMSWHALFKPTKDLMNLVESVHFGVSDVLLGIHIRLGGKMPGLNDAIRYGKSCGHSCLPPDLDWKKWFSSCALNITTREKQKGFNVVWFVTSDQKNSKLEWLFKAGKNTGINVHTLKKQEIVHVDSPKPLTKQQWLQTAADWYILSQANYVIASPSSFSLTAAMFNGHAPTMLGEVC